MIRFNVLVNVLLLNALLWIFQAKHAANSAENTHTSATTTRSDAINEKIQNAEALQRGKAQFEQVCAACHGKDLTGGVGFNLKDGEWVHGDTPEQIINNIKNGFPNAGMPAFGSLYSDEQLQDIVAYILSQQEGFSDLYVEIYQLNSADDTDITEDKLIKSGPSLEPLADFSLPETEHYYITFEGDFYAPVNQDTQVWLEWGYPHEFNLYIDGELQPRQGSPWYPVWPLKRGKQHLKMTYRSGNTKPGQRNLVLLGTTPDLKVKLFALSTRAQAVLEDKQFNVTANEEPVILRKRVLDLPTYTISVGFPEKLNIGFNTKNCSVNGLWQGDLMNIGPNISGRGEDPSIPLGDFAFSSPQSLFIKPVGSFSQHCDYQGYNLVNGLPVFSFAYDSVNYSLSPRVLSSNVVAITITSSAPEQEVALTLPNVKDLSWQVAHNDAPLMPGNSDQRLQFNADGTVVITATINSSH